MAPVQLNRRVGTGAAGETGYDDITMSAPASDGPSSTSIAGGPGGPPPCPANIGWIWQTAPSYLPSPEGCRTSPAFAPSEERRCGSANERVPDLQNPAAKVTKSTLILRAS